MKTSLEMLIEQEITARQQRELIKEQISEARGESYETRLRREIFEKWGIQGLEFVGPRGDTVYSTHEGMFVTPKPPKPIKKFLPEESLGGKKPKKHLSDFCW